jgi:hypothetical protein
MTNTAQPQQQSQQQAPQQAPVKTGISQEQAAGKIKNLLTPNAAQPKKPQQQQQQQPQKQNLSAQQRPKTQQKEAVKGQSQAGQRNTGADNASGLSKVDPLASTTDDSLNEEALDQTDDATALDGDNDQSTTDEADADAADEDGVDGEAEQDEENPEAETSYTVTVDGQDYEVSFEELVAGYQRQADYTKKATALAQERKEVEAIKAEVADLPEQRKQYQQGAEALVKNASLVLKAFQHGFMPPPPEPELAKTDPTSYIQQKERHQQALQLMGALQGELRSLEDQGKEEHQKAVKAGRVKLYEAMPEMKDEASRQKLRAYANSLGFSDENIANESSHVLFVCVEKARRWDELQASKLNLKDKKTLPKVTKRTNAQPSAGAVKERQKQNVLESHRSTRTIKSAESAIASLLKGGQ